MGELARRTPQASDGAQLDRSMSWSGRIFPKAEPCRDYLVLWRVHTALVATRHSKVADTGEQ